MLRFWHELFAFYHALSPAVSTLKRHYKSPVFGYSIAAKRSANSVFSKTISHGNCLTYALQQRLQQGGHIVMVKSRYGWWWHAYWMSDEGVTYEFAPVEPHRKVKKLWHPLPPMVYEGRQRVAPVIPREAVQKINALNGGICQIDALPEAATISVSAAPALRAAAA